jgi:hypothetical protein
MMKNKRAEQLAREQRVIEGLIDEHVRFHYDIVPIDSDTWAIHGSIAVDGEVILAEFATQDHARSALEQLSRAEKGTTRP